MKKNNNQIRIEIDQIITLDYEERRKCQILNYVIAYQKLLPILYCFLIIQYVTVYRYTKTRCTIFRFKGKTLSGLLVLR